MDGKVCHGGCLQKAVILIAIIDMVWGIILIAAMTAAGATLYGSNKSELAKTTEETIVAAIGIGFLCLLSAFQFIAALHLFKSARKYNSMYNKRWLLVTLVNMLFLIPITVASVKDAGVTTTVVYMTNLVYKICAFVAVAMYQRNSLATVVGSTN